MKYLVSACLAGLNCRYDGLSHPCAAVVELYQSGRAVLACPETLAGLPAPRPPSEQSHGRVISRDGQDLTYEFEKGATRALAIALQSGCDKAILKARSPSCGIGVIYDGSFTGTLCPGNGIFTQKLLAHGFEVTDEEHLEKFNLMNPSKLKR